MKKISAGVAAIIMLVNLLVPAVFSAADEETRNEDSSLKMAETVLEYLNITDSATSNESTVSRAEFAMLAAKLVGYIDNENTHYAYFADVPSDNRYCGYIAHLADREAISVPENRMFRPEDNITLSQAYKIMFSLAGYGRYIEDICGGFPIGYISMAERLQLNVKAADSEALSYAEVKKILFGFGNLGILLYGTDKNITNDNTILSSYYSLYMGEGIVTDTYVYSGSNRIISDKNIAVVDGKEYYCDKVDINSYFMDYTEFAYIENQGEINSLIALEKTKQRNKDLKAVSDDVISYDDSSHTLTYVMGSKSRNVKVNKDAALIYNGSFVIGDVSEYLKDFTEKKRKGSVRLKGYSGGYEYIIIDAYDSGVIAQIDYDNQTIYDRNHNYMITDLEEYDNIYITNSSGRPISVSSLSAGDTVNIASSTDRRFLRIVQGQQAASDSGKITTISGDYSELTLDNGNTYKIDESYRTVIGNNINFNEEYEIYTDMFGEVTDIRSASGTVSGFKIGYLVDGFYDLTGSIPDDNVLKIFDTDGKMNRYPMADKVTVDKVKKKDVLSAMAAIPGTKGIVDLENPYNSQNKPIFERQVIRYKLKTVGEKSEICEIDTAYCGKGEAAGSTLNRFRNKERLMYNWTGHNDYRRFSRDVLIDKTKTFIFNVPLVDSEGYCVSADESSWNLVSDRMTDIFGEYVLPTDDMYYMGIDFTEGWQYYTEAYNYDDSSVFADVVVLYRNGRQQRGEPMMVADKNTVLNDKEEVVQGVRCLYQSKDEWYFFPEEYDISDINIGDLIRVDINNADGMVAGVKKVFDRETLSYVGSDNKYAPYYYGSRTDTTDDYYQSWQLTKGYSVKHTDNLIKISYDLPEDKNGFDEVATIMDKKPIIYDSSRHDENAYRGNSYEIADYANAGAGCSFVIIYSHHAQLYSNIFVYK